LGVTTSDEKVLTRIGGHALLEAVGERIIDPVGEAIDAHLVLSGCVNVVLPDKLGDDVTTLAISQGYTLSTI
jgi:hypothetical protein